MPPKPFSAAIECDSCYPVLASRVAITARYKSESFDYDFPNALVAGMKRGELIAWEADQGRLSVASRQGASTVDKSKRLGVFTIAVASADALLLLDYNMFSLIAENRGKRLASLKPAPAWSLQGGVYEVTVGHVGDNRYELAIRRAEKLKRFTKSQVPSLDPFAVEPMWQSIYIMAKGEAEGVSLTGGKVSAAKRKKALETVRVMRDRYAALGAAGRPAAARIDVWLEQHLAST